MVFIATGCILLILTGYFIYESWLRGGGGGQTVTVTIPGGSTFDQVLDSLQAADLIGNRTAFKVLAKASGSDGKIKPGTYKFTAGISNSELLKALVDGHSTARTKITFPEGITIRRIAQIAAAGLGCDSAAFIHAATDTVLLRSLGIQARTAEGYLMPDTYFLTWGEKPETIIRRMVELHDRFWAEQNAAAKAAALKLTPYQLLILASLVEGEARAEGDRPIVAGVYLNRLRRGMKLQADPTIQYVLPDGPRRLLYADLRRDTPYNSYMYPGLPPTPINNPGRASILAAMNPASHDYLYFVARADGSGRHTFSRTGSEHEQAVKQYIKNRDSGN